MTDNLRRSIYSGNCSSQNIPHGFAEAHDPATAEVADSPVRQSDLALEIQALQILDSSDDCIKVLDLEGRILFMSRGGQVLLGIPDIKPFLNTSWIEFWQGADRLAAMDAIAKARTGEVCTFQGYRPTPSGDPKWWDIKISPIRGIEGQVERLLCISRDITERRQIEDRRRQTEEKLRESEERYRAIINQAVTGVACTDLDGNLTLVNQKYCDITGYSADELRQLRMQDITHPEDLLRNSQLFHRMRTEGTPFEIEKRYIRKDGSIVWVNNSVSVICDRDGEPQSAVAIVLDITERKQAALSAEFLATVTQNLAEATCVEDIIQTVGEQLHRYLQVSNCAFVEINESKEVAAIHHSWHLKEVPSLVGGYQLAEFVTDEFLQTAKAGQTLIIRDVTTDPRIADPERFVLLNIGSFINVPLIRENEWKFTLNIYHQTPYNWRSSEIELIRELADRIWTKLERTRVEIALRQSQEMFSALVADAPFGVYIVDASFRFLQANQTAIAAFNMGPLIGRDITEVLRLIWREPFATESIDGLRHTLATGEPYYSLPMAELRADIAEIQSYDWRIHRITLPDGSYGIVCYFYDLSEIKRAEEIIRRTGDRDAFLVTLNDALRPLNDPIEIQATANRVLGEYLGANRVAYFEVRGTEYVVEQDYVNGAESLRGGYPIESFGAQLLDAFRKGRTVAASDVAADPYLSPAQQSAYAAVQNAAHIGIPLVKQGEFVAGLAIHSSSPRNWTSDEIALAEEVAERTWAAVERARVEADLRQSEEKYRSLFTSIDEGFNLLEVIPDESGHPCDFRIVETNPAWEQQTGLTNATGKTLLEIAPDFEQQWLDFYSDVAISGRGRRTEYYTASTDRWYTVHASRIGGEGSRQVAVVFNDITERKRAEERLRDSAEQQQFLLNFSDALRVLPDKETIERTSLQLLAEYLHLDRVYIATVYRSDDRAVIGPEYRRPDLMPMAGELHMSDFPEAFRIVEEQTLVIDNIADHPTLSDLDRQSLAAINLTALVVASARRGERNVIWSVLAAMTTPRNWTAGEVALLEAVVERTWAGVERAKAEAALRESEDKYRSLFESMDEGYAVVEVLADDNGNWNDFLFLEVNPAFTKQTGMEYPVGRKATELLGTPNPRWAEVYGRVAQTGEPIRFEESEATLGRVFDLYVFRLGPDGSRRVAVLFTNITERKQVEAAIAADLRDTQLLRDLSARLTTETDIQVLYDEILAAAIALTQANAGTFQFFNSATQELLLLATQGISPALGEQFSRLSTSCKTSCGIALTTGERAFVDFDVPASVDPDGSMRMHVEAGLFSAQSTPLISRSGKLIGMVSTHWRTHHRPSDRELRFLDLLARQAADLIEQRQDEAQRKQLLEREQAAREEAEQANRIKDEFLAVLSHELRSPLNPILGWSTLLLNGKLDATKTTQALTTIQRNAKLQSELIEDLLDVARILRGKLSLNVAPVNLASTTRAAMETVRLAAEAKSIQIAASLSEDIGLVSGDPTRLQQVVWNLLSNAVKFTPPGGQVNIRLERFDSSAQITVSDTGQGISSDFLPYVFDYFRQADAATTRKFGGLGLGLAIVRYLVELHGGTVSVASPGVGQGATFTVRMPLMSTSSQANQFVRSPESSLDLNGIKILIVDDEPDTRELVAFVLEQQGAQAIAATSAHEALLILPQAKPDILLSDIGMPEMDGYMLIRQVRTLAPEQGGRIPAIALTAYAGDTNQKQVLAAGFQKHISKPIEPEELVHAIAHLVYPN